LITHNQSLPSDWVVRFEPRIPKNHQLFGRVLDYACGSGRHALFLQRQGHAVLAMDRDSQSLMELEHANEFHQPFPIELRCVDLEQKTCVLEEEGELFVGIIVTNYLYRPHLQCLFNQLDLGGVLIYETFAAGNERYGKPSNPNFLLKENELLEIAMANHLQILAFEQIEVTLPKPAIIQRICAVRTKD